MVFKALEHFKDLKDSCHEYNPGDIYPRVGLKVSEERLAELSGSNNKRRRPIIEELMPMPKEPVKEPVIDTPKEAAAEAPIEAPTEESKPEPKKVPRRGKKKRAD